MVALNPLAAWQINEFENSERNYLFKMLCQPTIQRGLGVTLSDYTTRKGFVNLGVRHKSTDYR